MVLLTWPEVWVWYWQVEMDEESKPLTTFTVGAFGLCKYERMPFRLTNAPTTFQQLMETYLKDLNINWCIIYLDDIVIFLKTQPAFLWGWRPCSKNWNRLVWNLSPQNASYFTSRSHTKGHIVSTWGIVTNEEKINVIKNPTTITEVWCFLGWALPLWALPNCQFITKFVQIAQPMHELTFGKSKGKKRAAITWNDMCQ